MYRAIVSQRVCRHLTFVVAIAATRAKYAKMKMFFNSLSFWYFNNKHHLFCLSLSSSFFFYFYPIYTVLFVCVCVCVCCIHLKCSLKFLDSNKLVISCQVVYRDVAKRNSRHTIPHCLYGQDLLTEIVHQPSQSTNRCSSFPKLCLYSCFFFCFCFYFCYILLS